MQHRCGREDSAQKALTHTQSQQKSHQNRLQQIVFDLTILVVNPESINSGEAGQQTAIYADKEDTTQEYRGN